MKNYMKSIERSIRRYFSGKVASYYIRKNSNVRGQKEKIKVGFLVHEIETWDKLQPVFEKMRVDDRFQVYLVVVPSFSESLKISRYYGRESSFFQKNYNETILAYKKDGSLVDLQDFKLDFVFYQDHYDEHYPLEYRSKRLVKYTRICYIPYGYSLLENLVVFFASHISFLRNVSIFFAENIADGKVVENLFEDNIKKGIQQVKYLGFPALESYMKYPRTDTIKTITWAPRWSYDKDIGGSHFLEYKETILALHKNPLNKLIIRPHPMMFENFKQKGIMTVEEIDKFKKLAEHLNVEIDAHGPIDAILKETDLLITDVSSIIVSFFSTGRPIIYCECEMEPNFDLKEMMKGMYIARSEQDIKIYTDKLLKGDDYLKETRERILASSLFSVHKDSSRKIIDFLYDAGNGRLK